MDQREIVNRTFEHVATRYQLEATAQALERNGMKAYVVETRDEARSRVSDLLPEHVTVMNMVSSTLEETGIAKDILDSGKYHAVRQRLESEPNSQQKRMLGSAPEWAVGSVQAITEQGQAVAVSATGSQLPAYAYGAGKVVWVVGGQKIVKDLHWAFRRIYEYVFPLENERALKVYGMSSGVHKVLIINREVVPDRIYVILVNEKLGF